MLLRNLFTRLALLCPLADASPHRGEVCNQWDRNTLNCAASLERTRPGWLAASRFLAPLCSRPIAGSRPSSLSFYAGGPIIGEERPGFRDLDRNPGIGWGDSLISPPGLPSSQCRCNSFPGLANAQAA